MPSSNVNRSWSPHCLVRWLFSQSEVWVTAAGREVRISEMEADHALNTVLMLERVADAFPFPKDELQSKPLYRAIKERAQAEPYAGRAPQPTLASLDYDGERFRFVGYSECGAY